MLQQTPILCISSGENTWSDALSGIGAFPLIDSVWKDAIVAIDRVQPAAVLMMDADASEDLRDAVAVRVSAIQPYVPLIAINPIPSSSWGAPNAIPFFATDGNLSKLEGRLNAALRVRALHAVVLRRMADVSLQHQLPDNDPLSDATVLLIGRGASYPGLSIALGEHMGVVGALSIEAAGKHLNGRDLDGIVIGEGFSRRVIDAFLTVLANDPRFCELPVILTGPVAFASAQSLPNLEIVSDQIGDGVANFVPLIRQRAFDARLSRALKSLDAGGLLDARTGLLTANAFALDFPRAIEESLARGGSLSAVRFTFDGAHDRICFDGARMLSRLMRRTDFATLQDDGSILVVFAETELRTAHMVARRLASVLRQTLHSVARDKHVDPHVTLVTLLPKDSPKTLLDRLYSENQRAAS